MKKFTKTIICLLLTVILSVAGAAIFFAETLYTSEGFTYTLLAENYISIYNWEGGSDYLAIPNLLDSKYVREIRNSCFLNRSDFTTVNFEHADYLNRIGYNAFKNSSISGSITIPDQVKIIGTGAFQNCDNIEILQLNAMVDVIASQCFYDCDALREVYLSDTVTRIESHAFSDCDSLQILRIPKTVTSINTYAFVNCPQLVIYCYTGSYAQEFAEENGIEYVLIDAPTPTEPPTEVPTEPTETPTNPATPDEPTPTEAPTDAPAPLLGDANGNGIVEIVDATLIQRSIAELPVPIPMETLMNGDADRDGELSITDATSIQRFLADLPVLYPIGQAIEQ